ncbi:hypothetical protein BH11VER1_BH11VER1_15350 [soil metagenome]
MKTLRCLAFLGGFFLIALTGYFWALHDFRESMKTDYWDRDETPNNATLQRLTNDWGFPVSIYRTVEKGNSSRANGDGERLEIYCFAPIAIPAMRQALNTQSGWVSGFPEIEGWREHILKNAPVDLIIGESESPKDFIHSPISLANMGMDRYWTIINVVRGIRYEIRIKT